MEKLRYTCRVEKKIQNHGVVMGEYLLGDDMVLVQCLGCGVMGIMKRIICRIVMIAPDQEATVFRSLTIR